MARSMSGYVSISPLSPKGRDFERETRTPQTIQSETFNLLKLLRILPIVLNNIDIIRACEQPCKRGAL